MVEEQTQVERLLDQKDVAGLVRSLTDPAECLRWEAADALGELGDAAAVPALIAALRDRCEVVRLCAADALGAIGESGPEVTAALIDLFGDRDECVRQFAFSALASAGDETAADAIRARLPRERRYRRPWMWAAYALHELAGEPFPFGAVMRMLRRGTYHERTSAAVCLAMIADAKTTARRRAALRRALKRERTVGMRGVMLRSLDAVAEVSG